MLGTVVILKGDDNNSEVTIVDKIQVKRKINKQFIDKNNRVACLFDHISVTGYLVRFETLELKTIFPDQIKKVVREYDEVYED